MWMEAFPASYWHKILLYLSVVLHFVAVNQYFSQSLSEGISYRKKSVEFFQVSALFIASSTSGSSWFFLVMVYEAGRFSLFVFSGNGSVQVHGTGRMFAGNICSASRMLSEATVLSAWDNNVAESGDLLPIKTSKLPGALHSLISHPLFAWLCAQVGYLSKIRLSGWRGGDVCKLVLSISN